MKYVVTALYWLVFLATAPFEFALGLLLFVVTAPFDRDRRALHAFICRWTFQYLRVMPTWHAHVEGRERLPKGPAVLVANHQSMADVIAAMGLYHSFKFVSKASLFSVPLVGWMMSLAKYVRLVRGRAGSTRRMMDACRAWLRRGVAVLLFPEGTYRESSELLPFKRGAFVLAIEEQVPLVPIVLLGTDRFLPGDGPWMAPRSEVRVKVLTPISPEELGTDPEALARRVRAMLQAELKLA